MNKRALGLFLMVAGACAYSAGCGSSGGGGGTGGVTGTGGHGGAAVGGAPGTGGHGGATGGAPGTGGAGTDAGTDVRPDVRPDVAPDAPADAPADVPRDVAPDIAIDVPTDRPPTDVAPADAADGGGHATFTQVYAILSNVTTPTPTTSSGCKNCHSGMGVDGGAPTMLPQSMDFSTKMNAYTALVNVDSLRCGSVDGSVGLKRVAPNSPDTSALISKLRAGLGLGTACGGNPMPRNAPGADGGPSLTMYAITMDQLNLIIDWINGGALNN